MPVNSFENYPMSWKPTLGKTGDVPLYVELAQALELDIREGRLYPNDKLPPQRELADYLDINLSTVARAFKLCAAKGLICGEVGRGTYVSADALSNLPMLDQSGLEHCIDLGASHPVRLQGGYVEQTLEYLVKKTGVSGLLEYAEPSGRLSHRRSGRAWLSQFGLDIPEENILISSGLQNSLAILMSSLFRYGDKVATNALTYPGFKNIASLLGIQLIPVPYQRRRMNLDYLIQLCRNEHIRGLYIIPDHHNPTAAYMDEEERARLAEIIRTYDLRCIEDATYSFLSEQIHIPISALVPDHSVYVSTVSNSLSAGLRLAFLGVPSGWMERVARGNSAINVMASPLAAGVTSQLIDSGLAQQIVREKRTELQRRNRLAEQYLSKYFLQGDGTAQFRWLELPGKWTGKAFEAAAKNNGVQVFCCERFAVGNSAVVPAARLAISTPKSAEQLEAGLSILADLLK